MKIAEIVKAIKGNLFLWDSGDSYEVNRVKDGKIVFRIGKERLENLQKIDYYQHVVYLTFNDFNEGYSSITIDVLTGKVCF